MPPPGSVLPKVLIAVLFLAILYQLSPDRTVSRSSDLLATTPGENSRGTWFQDAIKTQDGDDEEEQSPAQIVGSVIPVTLLPAAIATRSRNDQYEGAKARPTSAVTNGLDYSRIHVSYGPTKCMPTFDDSLKKAAIERNRSCTAHAPFPAEESRRVAFASITTGKPLEAYQRAILSQMFHSAVHGSSMYVLCEQIIDSTWNKIAYLLNLVINEMLKPEDERLEWMMWIDRDAIVLDACRPLSSYIPPATSEFDKIQLITNNDAIGLNNGVFLFRVSQWSVSYFNTVLAYRYFRPDDDLQLAEQSGMEKIMQEEKWKDSVVRVPWYWFNAYPDEENSVEKYKEGLEPEDLEWFRARRGDFIVHFAGDDGRSGRMLEWLNMLQEIGNVWEKGNIKRDISEEIQEYWASWKNGTLTEKQITGEPEPEPAN